MGDDFYLLFGVALFLILFAYWSCVPCDGRNKTCRRDSSTTNATRRPFMGYRFGFRETRQNQQPFQSGEPPPTYQWVVQHANSPLVAYVNETNGHIEYVKWDGSGPVPTRTVLGMRNEGLEMDTHCETCGSPTGAHITGGNDRWWTYAMDLIPAYSLLVEDNNSWSVSVGVACTPSTDCQIKIRSVGCGIPIVYLT